MLAEQRYKILFIQYVKEHLILTFYTTSIVLDKMFKQYQPVNGNIVFKKADEDAKMKELVFENGYVVEYEEALNVANAYPMTVKFAISAQTVKMDEATFTQDWPENN